MLVSSILHFYVFICKSKHFSNLISTCIAADSTLGPEDYYPHCFVLCWINKVV